MSQPAQSTHYTSVASKTNLSYNVYVVHYESVVRKAIARGAIPKAVVQTIHNAFLSLDATRDFALFDIKEIRGEYRRTYFRLRKGKYRAIFFVDGDIFVVSIGKRDEVCRLWE